MHRRLHIRPRFWLFMIAVMLVCFGTSYTVAQIRYHQASERLAQLSQQKAALTDEVSALNQELNYVKTDDYVQRVARDELNMIMPGEVRYVSN